MNARLNPTRSAGAVAVALCVMSLAGGCANRIPVASVGVKFNAFTGLSQQILKPEVVWTNPLTERLIIYPTGIVNATFVKASNEGDRFGDDSIKASTVEGAILPVDVTVAYRIPAAPESVKRVFENFGTEELREIQATHIRWSTVTAVNAVSGTKSIFDLLSRQRAQFGPDVKAILAPRLAKWGFTVEDVLIREIHPPAEITAKIQEQQAVRSDLEKAKVQRQQAAIDARTTLTNAQREAEQNRLLAQQGDRALQLKRLELRRKLIEKWDGQAPIIGSSSIPFMEGRF